jgi:hypothetical protein
MCISYRILFHFSSIFFSPDIIFARLYRVTCIFRDVCVREPLPAPLFYVDFPVFDAISAKKGGEAGRKTGLSVRAGLYLEQAALT